jgi:hypothetical protein
MRKIWRMPVRFTLALIMSAFISFAYADNQTPTVSPVYPEDSLPFTVEVVQSDFMLPTGVQSFASAMYEGKWLLITGRTTGLHGFDPVPTNFPPNKQSTLVFVIDPVFRRVWTRNLADPSSGLSQKQIDSLSVTNAQFFQKEKTLYITGGYGVDTATGAYNTKDTLTAIDLPGLMNWVMQQSAFDPATTHIRQISNSLFQITGGAMFQVDDESPMLIVFGQNFDGQYHGHSNGLYNMQIQRFNLLDDGQNLSVEVLDPLPATPDPNYRRRDLNIVPIMELRDYYAKPALMAYSGVFTLTGGAWTVPVTISPDGSSYMDDPSLPDTFKQSMNVYLSPTLGLYARKTRDMFTIVFGGITWGYFQDGKFLTDDEKPFTNQIITIKRDKHKQQSQYLMNASFPTILSEQSNPGNPLLFGASAAFFPNPDIECYPNSVAKFDHLPKEKTLLGYIVGGIQSTLPNTNFDSDSAASPYIFEVYITPK